MSMKILLAAAVIALSVGPAFAQATPIPQAGDDRGKTPQEIAAEKEAERAYQRSLGNIPAQKSADPWGTMRGDSAPKTVAKDPPAKRAKSGGTPN